MNAVAPTPPRADRRPLGLAELVDLEWQLERDRKLERREAERRDARIAQTLDARNMRAPALLRAWLRETRGNTPSPGAKLEELRRTVATLLAILGALLGASAVAGWLSVAQGRPVNVIYMWGAVVGFQLVLLCGWLVAILPERVLGWIPGARGVQASLRLLARWIPMAIGWLAARMAPRGQATLGEAWGRLKAVDRLYGRVSFWLLVRLTQVFAVAFNIGAVAAFAAMTLASDPALGWRSTLLETEQVHAAAQVLAAPWARLWPEAVPSIEMVAATRHWSLDPRFLATPRDGAFGGDAWGAWWAFMMASLVAYGLLPRLAALGLATLWLRRSVSRLGVRHPDLVRLRERLMRPRVSTQSEEREEAAVLPEPPPGAVEALEEAPLAPPALAMQWAGVGLEPEEAAALVATRLGRRPPAAVLTVGGVDTSADETALAAAESLAGSRNGDPYGTGAVVLLVEAWEPPVGDYVDFLEALRKRVGPDRPVEILLVHRDMAGRPTPPRAHDAAIWRRRIAAMGDRALGVGALVEEGAA